MSTHESIDVRYVAKLARLGLTDEEVATYQAQLDDILAYVAKLKELDVEAIEPTAHAMPVENVFRDDEPAPCLDRDEALANAPAVYQALFEVPPVIE